MRMTPTLAASSPHRNDWWMVKRDRLVGGDHVVVERGDGLDAPVAVPLGIEGRGADRVLAPRRRRSNRSSQACRSPASTAAIEARPRSRAVVTVAPWP